MLELAESPALSHHASALGALYREDARRLLLKVVRAALRLEFKDKVASVDLAWSHYAAFLQFWTSC